MAVTYPIGLAEYFAGLATVSVRFSLGEAREVLQTGGGDIISQDNGPRLWGGAVSVRPQSNIAMRRFQARTEALLQAGRTFSVSPMGGPASDPDGAILGASSVTISVAPDASTLVLSGLPAGYELSQGDYLSFAYVNGITRNGLYQVGEDAVADAGGSITLSMTSFLRNYGALGGESVLLVDPVCKAVILPGSYKAPMQMAGLSKGFSFEWRQTLR